MNIINNNTSYKFGAQAFNLSVACAPCYTNNKSYYSTASHQKQWFSSYMGNSHTILTINSTVNKIKFDNNQAVLNLQSIKETVEEVRHAYKTQSNPIKVNKCTLLYKELETVFLNLEENNAYQINLFIYI